MKHCNLDMLKSLSPSDNAFPLQVIGLFLKDIPVAVRKMQESAAAGDLVGLYKEAHAIKPSVQLIGVTAETEETLLRIIAYAKSESEEAELPGLVTDFATEMEAVYPELEAAAEELKG